MKLISISEYTKSALQELDSIYEQFSEMSSSERAFLTELLVKYKPKKILEVGVAAGSSSVVMLNALRNAPEALFFSIDYIPHYYRDARQKSGFILERYPELYARRKLFTGGFAANFLDEIGDDIDFCLIDTRHSYPGEILDFIMICPYLKKDAVVVLHDTNLHTFLDERFIVNNHLISALSGEKLLCKEYDKKLLLKVVGKNFYTPFANIAAVQLHAQQMENIWDVFNLLTTPWHYLPSDEDLLLFQNHLEKHYTAFYCNLFKDILAYQKRKFFADSQVKR